MTYVKADVDEDTHRYLRVEAAERGVAIDAIVAEIVESHTPDMSEENPIVDDVN